MNEKHTPGPWYCHPSTNFDGEYTIMGSYENGAGPRYPVLGRTHNFPKNAKANAQLIAAAPELLAACDTPMIYTNLDNHPLFGCADFPSQLETIAGILSHLDGLNNAASQLLQRAAELRSAIAKAKGD